MKNVTILLIALIALGALALTYFTGYRVGVREDDRRHLAMSLDMDVDLYQKAEHEDLVGLKGQLGFFIHGQYNFYAEHFGDTPFLHYDDARRIVAIAATNGNVIGFKKW